MYEESDELAGGGNAQDSLAAFLKDVKFAISDSVA